MPWEAKYFIKSGNIEVGSRLAVSMYGGQLVGAYIHGLNGLADGGCQLLGQAVNQVAGVHDVLLPAGSAALPATRSLESTGNQSAPARWMLLDRAGSDEPLESPSGGTFTAKDFAATGDASAQANSSSKGAIQKHPSAACRCASAWRCAS